MRRFLAETTPACTCRPTVDGDALVVDVGECGGDLATDEACRQTVIDAIGARPLEKIVLRNHGIDRMYTGPACECLVAASQFADRAAFRDERLAEHARRDPVEAAHLAANRAGPVADIAHDTGFDAFGDVDYEDFFRPTVGLSIAQSQLEPPPAGGTFVHARTLTSDATVRHYRFDDRPDLYHVSPVEREFDVVACGILADAASVLAEGTDTPGRAVREVATPAAPVERITDVLRKHTRGYGVLEDLFADPRVSDVSVSAPASTTPVWVTVDGDRRQTNVRLTDDGVRTLASRFRGESGRGFDRATPHLDTAVEVGGRRVRVAGLTDPVSDGPAYAFRASSPTTWTLPGLVENGTMSPVVAALLSVAVERGAAILVAGARGSGKTTLLSALLWELPSTTRLVAIEDTRELPIRALQRHERDAQSLVTTTGDEAGLTPTEALRAALRLGDGALVVGEVRGTEARALYEAMRVGAASHAVLGTIHGDGARDVRERVVTDLDVPASSFASTDLVVTVEATGQGTQRRVRDVQAVNDGFQSVFERGHDESTVASRVEAHVDAFTTAHSTSDSVDGALAERARTFRSLAETGRTTPLDRRRAPTT